MTVLAIKPKTCSKCGTTIWLKPYYKQLDVTLQFPGIPDTYKIYCVPCKGRR